MSNCVREFGHGGPIPALASRVVPNQGQDAGRLVIVPRSKTGLMHLRSRDCQQARGLSAGEGRLEGRSSRLGLASLGPLPQVSNGRTSPRPTRPSSGLWTFRPLYRPGPHDHILSQGQRGRQRD